MGTHPVSRAWRGLLGAVAFLTIVPLPASAVREEGLDLGAAIPWFPLVGGAVGALAGGVRAGLVGAIGRGPSTVVAMIALVAVTGALHQDALADTADGLGVRGDRERRLAVMRDSTLGAFGVLALVLWGLLLFSALEALGPAHGVMALVAAGAAGRLAAPLHGLLAQPARREGLGAGLGAGYVSAALAFAVAAGVAVAAAGPARGALALGVSLVSAGLTAGLARVSVGGSTGDTLGAAVAVAEVLTCLALVASWR